MSKNLKRILGIYFIGVIIITICTLIYYFFRSNLVFIFITIFVFLVSYLMLLWFRLFMKTKPYYGKYRKSLLDFARENGFLLKDIYIRKSNHFNACSFGLFNNKAVTFNSQTLEKCPYNEIEGVMAHELGHHVNFNMYIYTAIVATLLILLTLINFSIYLYIGGEILNIFYICFVTTIFTLPFALGISRYIVHYPSLDL